MKSTLVEEPEKSPVDEGASWTHDYPGARTASSISLVGTSFKTSSLAFREGLAMRLPEDLADLARLCGATECGQLVTCNRIEVVVSSDRAQETVGALLAWMEKTPGFQPGFVYVRRGVDAISHLFRVASGLDSMVVGEDQILSQVKEAGVGARASGSSRGVLSALFDASVGAGERARAALDPARDSVSSAALRYALGRLSRPPRNVLLIGTGKTARLAANELKGARIYLSTRRGVPKSFPKATLVRRNDLKRVAKLSELIVAATKRAGYVLKEGDLGRGRHVVLDLAFPRNVDPRLAKGDVEIYNLEDLAKVFAASPPTNRDHALAEAVVSSEAERFSRWLMASKQSPALSRVYRWAESTRKSEAEAALRRLPGLTAREKKVVEAMSRRLVSKLLAPATTFAKSSTAEFPQDQRLDIVERVFNRAE